MDKSKASKGLVRINKKKSSIMEKTLRKLKKNKNEIVLNGLTVFRQRKQSDKSGRFQLEITN